MVKKVVKKIIKKVVKPVAKKAPVKKIVKEVVIPVIERRPSGDYLCRMNRIQGQVGGVKRMIEDEKGREEIIVQLKAVRSAIKALESELLEVHLQEIAAELSSGNAAQKSKKISDLKKLFLRFE